ncbi:hypothetical protein BU17DRAFT_67073 [Hysterangium stoloniferum]|nr:hypothetical protein BU17DRAFT_67073 [Hysterangium stoloniferum]
MPQLSALRNLGNLKVYLHETFITVSLYNINLQGSDTHKNLIYACTEDLDIRFYPRSRFTFQITGAPQSPSEFRECKIGDIFVCIVGGNRNPCFGRCWMLERDEDAPDGGSQESFWWRPIKLERPNGESIRHPEHREYKLVWGPSLFVLWKLQAPETTTICHSDAEMLPTRRSPSPLYYGSDADRDERVGGKVATTKESTSPKSSASSCSRKRSRSQSTDIRDCRNPRWGEPADDSVYKSVGAHDSNRPPSLERSRKEEGEIEIDGPQAPPSLPHTSYFSGTSTKSKPLSPLERSGAFTGRNPLGRPSIADSVLRDSSSSLIRSTQADATACAGGDMMAVENSTRRPLIPSHFDDQPSNRLDQGFVGEDITANTNISIGTAYDHGVRSFRDRKIPNYTNWTKKMKRSQAGSDHGKRHGATSRSVHRGDRCLKRAHCADGDCDHGDNENETGNQRENDSSANRPTSRDRTTANPTLSTTPPSHTIGQDLFLLSEARSIAAMIRSESNNAVTAPCIRAGSLEPGCGNPLGNMTSEVAGGEARTALSVDFKMDPVEADVPVLDIREAQVGVAMVTDGSPSHGSGTVAQVLYTSGHQNGHHHVKDDSGNNNNKQINSHPCTDISLSPNLISILDRLVAEGPSDMIDEIRHMIHGGSPWGCNNNEYQRNIEIPNRPNDHNDPMSSLTNSNIALAAPENQISKRNTHPPSPLPHHNPHHIPLLKHIASIAEEWRVDLRSLATKSVAVQSLRDKLQNAQDELTDLKAEKNNTCNAGFGG